MDAAETAGILMVDLMRNRFHEPLVDGKANRSKMEDAIMDGVMEGKLTYYIDKETADLAFDLIDELLETAA